MPQGISLFFQHRLLTRNRPR